MAENVPITLSLERDQQFVFEILNDAQDTAINVTGWATSFMVKRDKSDADAAALLTNTSGVISGVFNATPSVNTQRITVTVADTDCLSTAIPEGQYRYEFERTDAGYETTLAYGTCEAILGVQR